MTGLEARLLNPLTAGIAPDRAPMDLAAYEAGGGYESVRRALAMAPGEVTEQVKAAKLRGRGGAGFPTGAKWSFVPMGPDAPRPKYVVCNADEMEPGAFKDRLLLEGDPHQVIEGMIVSAWAVQAEAGYIFLRWAYRDAARRLERAIAEARDAGWLGEDILGSGWSLDLHLHVSAGRYICGEETALLEALEGRRAIPRAKPPFPPVSGLWGRPTIVQNVETLCNVPHIINFGADWYRRLARSQDGGTKLYAVSGRVVRPGVWELPLGASAREVIYDHAGGMRPGHRLRGFLPGGASTDFLIAADLEVSLDYESVSAAGSRLGTGTLVVLDDRACPVGMLLALQRFFARESCGWCTPCRDGLPWLARTIAAIEAGDGRPADLEVLRAHPALLSPGNTFCALAPGAMEPLKSALVHFGDDFERHVAERRCPYARDGGEA